MIQDALLQLSSAQSLTAGSQASTNAIDLGIGRDLGKGDSLDIDCRVTTAFAGGTSVQVSLQAADDSAFSTNLTTIVQTAAVPTASLVAGASIPLHLDRAEPFAARRYMRLYYTVVGTYTAGAVNASIVKNIQDPQVSYPAGFSVV